MDRHSPYALVADDDTLIRMDACEILKEAGFRCHDAATAEQAVELLGSFGQNIQLLFTDVSMPPGTMTSAEPASRASRAIMAACMPEPHILLMVVASVEVGRPAPMPA